MSLNPFFNNFNYKYEQDIQEDLGIELIQMFGLEVYYIKRSHINIDKLFLEDPLSKFESAQPIEMLMKDFYGYGQLSDIMSKFGPNMGGMGGDTLTMCVMRKRFAAEFPEMIRPFEGDLVFIPMVKTLFEVKYVEHEDNFYQHGNLTYFELKLERFNYSSEELNTGIEAIDVIEQKFSLAVSDREQLYTEDGYILEMENGDIIITENPFPLDDLTLTLENGEDLQSEDGDDLTQNRTETPIIPVQNQYIERKSLEIIDFSVSNPFGKL